jgi:hypothetical protein
MLGCKAYTMRSVLNIAITEMVYREGHNKTVFDNSCPAPGGGFVAEREGFHWSEQLQGGILGAFFWGYVSLHQQKVILKSRLMTCLGTHSRSRWSFVINIWRKVHA